MALAARCPHCRALFRVIADQLKLRGGLVRCGECRKVFDAIGSLTYVDDEALLRAPSEAPLAGSAQPGPEAPAPARPPEAARAAPPPLPVASPPPARPERNHFIERASDLSSEMSDAASVLGVPTLFRPAEESAPPPPAPPPEEHAGETKFQYFATVLDDSAATREDAESDDAPAFLLPSEQRRSHWVLGLACVPLALAALLQSALVVRDDVLQAWPGLHPLVVRACSLYGCNPDWPSHAELLTIVGSDLVSVPGTDVIELNAAIRSRASFVMALPAIEVTLTDAQNHTIARKVFLPVDYLASSGESSSRLNEGLAPDSDLSVRLIFEAQGLNATGFVLYPFYM